MGRYRSWIRLQVVAPQAIAAMLTVTLGEKGLFDVEWMISNIDDDKPSL